MHIAVQILCVIGIVILLTPLIARLGDRNRERTRRRYESWLCPKCGEIFGPQHEQRGWVVRRNPYIPGAPMKGPILHCKHCQLEFGFDSNGRQVNDWKEYVTDDPHA